MSEAVAPGRATWSIGRESLPYDFRYGEPSYDDLPLDTWSRLLGRRARRLSVRRLAYQPPGGAAELREALAGYLARARGVVCEPEQILIVHGSQQAIDLSTRLLVDPGDRVVLEEPHYTGFSFCANAAGAKLLHVRVDEQGLRTDELAQIENARLACVTPSHQYPTGAVLSLPRRLALLDWAARATPTSSKTTTTASSASTASRSSACRRSTATAACSTPAPRRSCSSRRCASAGWSRRRSSRRTS